MSFTAKEAKKEEVKVDPVTKILSKVYEVYTPSALTDREFTYTTNLTQELQGNEAFRKALKDLIKEIGDTPIKKFRREKYVEQIKVRIPGFVQNKPYDREPHHTQIAAQIVNEIIKASRAQYLEANKGREYL